MLKHTSISAQTNGERQQQEQRSSTHLKHTQAVHCTWTVRRQKHGVKLSIC